MLPGDTQHSCFLVLDLVNKTSHEMELGYAEKKRMLIEAGDMCRVPVPVTKCSFSESLEWSGGGGGVGGLEPIAAAEREGKGEGRKGKGGGTAGPC